MVLKVDTCLEGYVSALKGKVKKSLSSQNKNLFRSSECNEKNYEKEVLKASNYYSK